MEKTRTIRTWGSFLLLLLLLFVFLIWNVLAGSVKLPVSEILEILRGRGDGTQSRIASNQAAAPAFRAHFRRRAVRLRLSSANILP